MKHKNTIYICLAGILTIAVIGGIFYLNTRRNDYYYTMDMIRNDIHIGTIIEVHGNAEEPFKRNGSMLIAGEGDGSFSWKENGVKKEKKYEVIPDYMILVTPYLSRDGTYIYVITKVKEPSLEQKGN